MKTLQPSAFFTKAQAKRWRTMKREQIEARIVWLWTKEHRDAKKRRRKAAHDARRRNFR